MARVAISSGHGLKIQGASGVINEVEQARRVTDKLAEELLHRGVEVFVFHDDDSTTQSQNLERIVSEHNSCGPHDLDISVHFNAFEQRSGPVGTEVWFYSQEKLAKKLSAAMADAAGFIDRGAKYSSSLAFLNGTHEPAVLLEVCFVDSEADCDLYDDYFDEICNALADVLGGPKEEIIDPVPIDPPPEEIEPPPHALPVAEVYIDISSNDVDVKVFVNGMQIGTKG